MIVRSYIYYKSMCWSMDYEKVSGVVILLDSTDTAGFAQSEKLIILNTNTGQNTDADTGQNAGAGEQNSSDTTENTDNVNTQQTGNVDISAPSALLMEASTGQVIYEKDADSKRPPASVTKVMTLLLIFDALQEGKIHLEDEVTTSEYAASMGGSQVFLEPGEVQTVETLIKCISVASANRLRVSHGRVHLWK